MEGSHGGSSARRAACQSPWFCTDKHKDIYIYIQIYMIKRYDIYIYIYVYVCSYHIYVRGIHDNIWM